MDASPHEPGGDPSRLTRRRLLRLGMAVPVPLVLAACEPDDPTVQSGGATQTSAAASATTTAGGQLSPTPACDDGDDPRARPEEPRRSTGCRAGREARWTRR